MADDVTLDPGAGGATVAADDIAGVHHQRVKVQHGADGSATDVSATSPLPARLYGWDGAALQQVATDNTGVLQIDLASAVPAGTNNIGDVDVASSALPTGASTAANQSTANTALAAIQAAVEILDNIVSGSEAQVDLVAALPAGTNLIGKAAVGLKTDEMFEGSTALTPKFAVIDAATSGDNTIVAANATKKIRVLAGFLIAAGTVNARFEGGAAGTALTGQMNLVANSGFVLPFNPAGWFETAANTLLNLELSAAISVDGCLTYLEVS